MGCPTYKNTSESGRVPRIINLFHFGDTVSEPADFKVWKFRVIDALKLHGLDHLIKSSVKRPPNDKSATSNNWLAVSTLVGSWIIENISGKTMATLRAQHERLQLADEVFDAVTNEFRGISTFIDATKAGDWDGWVDLKVRSMEIAPYAMLMIVVSTMGDNSIKDMIITTLNATTKNPATTLNSKLMHRHITYIIDRLQAKAAGSTYQATSRNATKTPKSNKDNKKGSSRRRNYKTVVDLKDQKNRPGQFESPTAHT
ncbi:hypothetical protein N7490_004546 [Penicillium lividum]|nr:hypothetical protein N7490_004546 [Penicillium lividum]